MNNDAASPGKKRKPKLIGKGSYGCVYEPNIPCKNLVKNVGVGKVMKTDDAHDEYGKNKAILEHLIKTVDDKPIDEFMNPIVGECPVRLSKDQLKECEPLKNLDEVDQYQLIYKHSGTDLQKMLGEGSFKLMTLHDNVAIMKMFEKLVRGLNTTFCNQKKSHMDIKPANILHIHFGDGNKYAEGRFLPIDFGLVSDFKKIYTIENIPLLEYEYPYFPFEFKLYGKTVRVASDILNNPMVGTDLLDRLHSELYALFLTEQMFNTFLETVHDPKLNVRVILEASMYKRRHLKTFVSMASDRMYNDVKNMIDKLIKSLKIQRKKSKKKKDDYVFFKHQIEDMGRMLCPEKIDVYSVGITLLNVLNSQGRGNLIFQLKHALDPKLILKADELKRLLEKCVTCNMYERHSFETLMKGLDAFNGDILLSHPIGKSVSVSPGRQRNEMRKCKQMDMETLERIASANKVKLIGYSDKDEICEELSSYLPKSYRKEMAGELMGWPFHNKKIKVITTPSPKPNVLVSMKNVKTPKNVKSAWFNKLNGKYLKYIQRNKQNEQRKREKK